MHAPILSTTLLFLFLFKFYLWRVPAGRCVWVHFNFIYFTSAEHRGYLPPVELNIHFSLLNLSKQENILRA